MISRLCEDRREDRSKGSFERRSVTSDSFRLVWSWSFDLFGTGVKRRMFLNVDILAVDIYLERDD